MPRSICHESDDRRSVRNEMEIKFIVIQAASCQFFELRPLSSPAEYLKHAAEASIYGIDPWVKSLDSTQVSRYFHIRENDTLRLEA